MRNTRIDADGSVTFYRTKILTHLLGGSFSLSSGGFQTPTTKNRLNHYLPPGFKVFQKNHKWFLNTPEGHIPFEDGMVINRD